MTTGNGSAIGCARSRAGIFSSRKRRFIPSMLSRRFPSLRWCLPFSVSYAGAMLSSDREKTACAGARRSPIASVLHNCIFVLLHVCILLCRYPRARPKNIIL